MTKHPSREPLQVVVTGRNTAITERLQTYVKTKIGHLDRFLDRLSEIDVVLVTENAKEPDRRNVAIGSTTAMGRDIRAQGTGTDMHAAIDSLVDKLHQQLTKLKERSRSHSSAHRSDTFIDDVAAPADTDDDIDLDAAAPSGERVIVRTKQLATKPLFTDEAIDEMEELGQAFYVFLSAESEKVNVVYRRRDGAYGLIEPAFE